MSLLRTECLLVLDCFLNTLPEERGQHMAGAAATSLPPTRGAVATALGTLRHFWRVF